MPRKPTLPVLDYQASIKMTRKLARTIERIALEAGVHPATWMRLQLERAVDACLAVVPRARPRKARAPAMPPPVASPSAGAPAGASRQQRKGTAPVTTSNERMLGLMHDMLDDEKKVSIEQRQWTATRRLLARTDWFCGGTACASHG